MTGPALFEDAAAARATSGSAALKEGQYMKGFANVLYQLSITTLFDAAAHRDKLGTEFRPPGGDLET